MDAVSKRSQRRLWLISGALLVVAAAISAAVMVTLTRPDSVRSASGSVGLDIGMVAPDFQTVTADGQPVSLSALRGDYVLLNFWATWCGPCRVEMPEFQRQYERYAHRGFTILAVNHSETNAAVRDFQESLALTFPLAMDERGQIQRQYGIFSYPSTFLIDPDGRIITRHFGPLTVDQIDQLLTEAGFSSEG
ncbi:MAG TPA: TlpA disulfide reductase family protein [Aggregatilineales bacterium]|nr:TlpA disulfide reductase family protein [Aggregatilineales bacterium]